MFIVKRSRSQKWQLELRFPGGYIHPGWARAFFRDQYHFRMSLGTTDRTEAEAKAAPYIHAFRVAVHENKIRREQPIEPTVDFLMKWAQAQAETNPKKKAKLLAEADALSEAVPKPAVYGKKARRYEDGVQRIDGKPAFVQGDKISFLDANLQPTGDVAENPLVTQWRAEHVDDADTAAALRAMIPDVKLPTKYMPKAKSKDDEIVEHYIRDRKLSHYLAQEATTMWELYKAEIGLPLAKAKRTHGKQLVALLQAKGYARGTIQKKIGWLNSAVRLAIVDGLHAGINPFTDVLPDKKPGDEMERAVFTEAHMATFWRDLGKLSEEDRLLWKLLAKTGMRLSEARSIRKVETCPESGLRFVWVGTKTESSRRRVPIPRDIGFPDHVDGPIFTGTRLAASKRLGRFIDNCLDKEAGPEYVLHSLRHRAVQIFRDHLKGHPHLRRRLLGHEGQDVDDEYGKHPQLPLLIPLLDGNKIDGTMQLIPQLVA